MEMFSIVIARVGHLMFKNTQNWKKLKMIFIVLEKKIYSNNVLEKSNF